MRPLEKLNFLITTIGRLFVAMFNVRLWPPFLIYMLVMAALIFVIQNMFSPIFSSWVVPLAVAVSDQAALHFPTHLLLLSYIFERFNLLPSLLLESLLMGAAVLMFASYYLDEKVSFGRSLRAAGRQYPKLLVIWLVNFVLIYLLFELLPGLFRDFTAGSPRRQFALIVGMQGLSVLLTSLFVYVSSYLLIQKRSLLASFTGSFNLFFRNFFTTYFFVLIPNLLVFALVFLFQNGDDIISKFHPRVMIGLTYLYALVMTAASFFTLGGIVRYFLEVAED